MDKFESTLDTLRRECPELFCRDCGGLVHNGKCIEVWKLNHKGDKV